MGFNLILFFFFQENKKKHALFYSLKKKGKIRKLYFFLISHSAYKDRRISMLKNYIEKGAFF